MTIYIRQKSLNCIPEEKVNWWALLYANYTLINLAPKTRQLWAETLKVVPLEKVNEKSLGLGFVLGDWFVEHFAYLNSVHVYFLVK